jgi:antitoxin ParD1/3/4
MSNNMPFRIGAHFSGFVKAQVREGRYSSASDVVRAGLRLLEDQDAKLAALRGALADGGLQAAHPTSSAGFLGAVATQN